EETEVHPLWARSIPTCVGLTARRSGRRADTPVHPHVRGAHVREPGIGEFHVRSIPTCVGLTVPHGATPCGETGPSPRAWGSHDRRGERDPVARSIPTCVGLTEDDL